LTAGLPAWICFFRSRSMITFSRASAASRAGHLLLEITQFHGNVGNLCGTPAPSDSGRRWPGALSKSNSWRDVGHFREPLAQGIQSDHVGIPLRPSAWPWRRHAHFMRSLSSAIWCFWRRESEFQRADSPLARRPLLLAECMPSAKAVPSIPGPARRECRGVTGCARFSWRASPSRFERKSHSNRALRMTTRAKPRTQMAEASYKRTQ